MRSGLVCLLLGAVCAAAQTPDVTGKWLGTLNVNSISLRLGLHIDHGEAGSLTGKFDSIDQSAYGIKMSKIDVRGRDLTFEVNVAAIQYKGALSEDGKEITGTFTQGASAMPLSFKRVDDMPSTAKPQEPKKPYPYDEIEVSYENTMHKIRLAGTLTVPRQSKPVPAVLLITGSGPQDRDESVLGHKPFLVLADHLTRHGIAVLRVDDRGVGGSTGNVSRSTSLDFAQDVMAGIAYLKTRKEVDASRIGLVGHSEGGLIAPIVASQSKDVAFIVMMAGTSVSGEQVLYEQGAAIMRASAATEDAIIAQRELQKKVFELLRTESDDHALAEKVAKVGGAGFAQMVANPWFRAFFTLDPADYLRKVTCPVLALNGEKDTQVVARQNLPVIVKSLEEAGNRDYSIVKFPALNHLFQTARTGAPAEYGKIEETVAPVVLETISNWVLQHTSQRSSPLIN